MIKMFCDVCNQEVERNYVSRRLNVGCGRFRAEVMVTFEGVSNKGHICRLCLMKILFTGEEVE